MRELTRPNNAWEWSDKQERALREIKQAITKAPVLRYFDTTKPTLMQCDASSLGLGPCFSKTDNQSRMPVER